MVDMFYDTDGDEIDFNRKSGRPSLINLIKTQEEILKSILTFGTNKGKTVNGGKVRKNKGDYSDDDD